jgi:hypothetical protein
MWRNDTQPHYHRTQNGTKRRPPTQYELEAMANTKIGKIDRTVVRSMFAANWSIVVLEGGIVGMSRFRDASLVLPMYGAAKVLGQLTDYFLEDKPRLGLIPYGLFLPTNGKPNSDYFLTGDIIGMRALVNYALASAENADEHLLARCADPASPVDVLRAYMSIYSVAGIGPDNEATLEWPSVY